MQVCILFAWWFAYYLCVWAVSCVCWRGVWEGHHCGRIIMKIQNPDWPALSICHCCLFVPYSLFFISFYSLPSSHKCLFFSFGSLLHTTLITSDNHVEYHHRISSIYWIETRDLLVLLKSEFQVAVVSCTVALEVGLKQQVRRMEKALMELRQAAEHEILTVQLYNECSSILCVLHDPCFCCHVPYLYTCDCVSGKEAWRLCVALCWL